MSKMPSKLLLVLCEQVGFISVILRWPICLSIWVCL